MKVLIATVAALAVAGTAALAQQTALQGKAPAEAVTFAKKVASSNTFEIQSSELANERAQSDQVRSFADQMIADHTKAGQDFETAVQAAKVPPPPEEPNAKQKNTLAKLRNARGAAFDRAYINAQLTAHKEAVSLFRTYAKNGRSAPLKEFAQTTLPTLEHHLSMVQELRGQGGVARKQVPKGGVGYGPAREQSPSKK
jgi:putative membrane protein